MRNRKFSLHREKDSDVQASNWKILGYALPSIGIFLILAAFIVDPYIAYWSTILLAWWLVPIIIISYVVLFFISLKKKGVLRRTMLRLSMINLILFLFLIFVKMPAYNCDPVKMAKHYDRNTEQFDDLITYVYSPAHIQNPRKLKRLLRKAGCI